MYKLEKNKSTKIFEVIEVASETVISNFKTYDEARMFYRTLKSGKGFSSGGWTPSFFLVKVPKV